MATVLEQLKAQIAAEKAKAAEVAVIQAQPGPTVAKADLDRKVRVEDITQSIAGGEKPWAAQYLPDTEMFTHGATFGLDIPLSGLAKGLDFWNHPGSSFSERYEAGEEARRRRLNISEAEAPLPVVQEAAGTILSGGPAGSAARWAAEQAGERAAVPAAQSLLRTATEAGGVGAGTGAIHGVATGEGDWRDRVLQGGKEALVGGVAGTLLGPAGRALTPGPDAASVARVNAADEFGIPLTRGQATADIAQQRAEQELIHGTRGDAPQRDMKAHQTRVDTARQGAVENIRDRFSPYRGNTQEESGQLLADSVRRRAERLRTVGGGRIDQALESGAEVDASRLLELPGRLQTRLAGPNPQVPEHYIGVNTPVAAEAMQRVDDFIGTIPNDPNARISLAGVNQLRRNLLGLTGQSDLDNRALAAVKNEVDNWINDIAGSDPALATLRHGNDLYRQGSEILAPRGRDVTPADRNVAKLAREDAVGSDAVRMFSVNQRGGITPETTRTARAISERFGPNSPQMQRVRDISAASLLDGGPQQVASQIDNFLATNRAAAETLFSREQIAELERFRDVSRSMVPQAGATNRGQSGYGPMKAILRNSLVAGGALLGSQVSDMGLIAQGVLTGAGALGGQAVGAAGGRRAVNRALTPLPGAGVAVPVATSTARALPGQMPDQETLDRLMQATSSMFPGLLQSEMPVPVESEKPEQHSQDFSGFAAPVIVEPTQPGFRDFSPKSLRPALPPPLQQRQMAAAAGLPAILAQAFANSRMVG